MIDLGKVSTETKAVGGVPFIDSLETGKDEA